MKKHSAAWYAIFAALVLLSAPRTNDAQTGWVRQFGGIGNAISYAVVPAPDNSFLVVGDSLTLIMEYWLYIFHHVHLFSLAPSGAALWTQTYEFQEGAATAAVPGGEGNFIVVAGAIDTSSLLGNCIYLMKVSPQGDTLWTRTYRWPAFHWPEAIAAAQDGNFLIVADASGISASGSASGACFLKINPSGDTLWTKQYFWPEYRVLRAVARVSGGGFVVGGYAEAASGQRAFMVRIGEEGDTVWSRVFQTIEGDVSAIARAADGNFFAAAGGDTTPACFFKFGPGGDTLWTKTCCRAAGPFSIVQTADNGCIAAGGVIAKINAAGDTNWTIPQGDSGFSTVAIAPDGNGNYVAARVRAGGGEIRCIIDDKYAKKDSLFVFRLPVRGDTLGRTYSPMSIPSGLAVSPGGTLSWTPAADSAYVFRVACLVSDSGGADTVTFNLFVNCRQRPNNAAFTAPHSRMSPSRLTACTRAAGVTFSVPVETPLLEIVDVRGRSVAKLPVVNNTAVWHDEAFSGIFFAQVKHGEHRAVVPFFLVR
jgi:Putative Ig domain